MELKEIQSLIKFVSESQVDELTLERKDFKISIKKAAQQTVQMVQAAPVMAVPGAPVAPPPTVISAIAPAAPAEIQTPAGNGKNIVTIKSPMIGTFYRSSAPDKPSFVNPGDEIKPGKVVCIVEAMKLFNEIEAEISGKIVKILVENATPVEYDQPLFEVEVG